MYSLLTAACVIGALLAPHFANSQETDNSTDGSSVAEYDQYDLVYDTEQLDADTAADIKAVVEAQSDPETKLRFRRAENEDEDKDEDEDEDDDEDDDEDEDEAAADAEQSTTATFDVATPSGYTDLIAIGEVAINAFTDCNGENTYMGFQLFAPPTFDIQLCANACSETTA